MRSLLTTLVGSVALIASGFVVTPATALEARDGWAIHDTDHGFSDLVGKVRDAVKAHDMLVVSQASASAGAKGQGITIPGNHVIGVYRNDYARRMLAASIAAGIEAPIRFYVTEDEDGTATLSYKIPTAVFSPYFDEGGDDLKSLADELDDVFATIAADAIE